MTYRSMVPLVPVILLLVLGACASPPVQEFRDYSQAFTEARVTSEVLLDDVALAMAVADSREEQGSAEATTTELFPKSFDPTSVLGAEAPGEPPAIAARRVALATVAQYNEVLLRLAEGRTVEEAGAGLGTLGERATQLASLAGAGANPLIGIGVSALQEAVKLAERARARREFEKAILSGYGSVQGILQALVNDTPTLYEIQKQRFQFELTDAQAEVNEVLNTMRELAGSFGPPRDGTALASEHERIETELSFALSNVLGRAVTLDLPPSRAGNAPAYSQQVSDSLGSQLDLLKSKSEEHQAIVEKINAYHAALGSYVAMLYQVQRALTTVKTLVETPQEPTEVARNVIRSGLELREKVQVLRAELGALRAGS